MRPYNLLLIDGNDRVSQIQTIEPVDQASALQTAEAVLKAYETMSGFELWQGTSGRGGGGSWQSSRRNLICGEEAQGSTGRGVETV